MDKRPRKEDGSLFISCKSCGVPPDRCKDSTGKEKIVTPDGEVVAGRILVGERGDGAGYISHFASCKKYRR